MSKESKKVKQSAAPEEQETIWGRIDTVVGNADPKGGVTQVKVKILSGPDANKTLRRNVRGPIRVGDVIEMTETELEPRPVFNKDRR